MSGAWWSTKSRQFIRHLFARVTPTERAQLATWLAPAQLALFDSMHRADQRHGLDVVRTLRAAGHAERDVLLAGLLHDCAKGHRVGVWHRVGWSLADRYGARVRGLAVRLPGFADAFVNLDMHAERSAELALLAGCSRRTAELIQHQAQPIDAAFGEALRLADEAS
ncbi:MAG: hypothetical protein M3N29_10990 [Chloroflexota bacterium]|nr:hypothetical protein [Chloroflexota bacterium]